MGIELIFCYGDNRAFAEIAINAGYRYGVRLPEDKPMAPIYFADQNWTAYQKALKQSREAARSVRAGYMAALAQHQPEYATVLDWERADQLVDVLDWAEEAAQWSERIVIIPKIITWSNPLLRLPRSIGGRAIVLGYSVPTRHGGTDVPLYQFAGWPIHLLGGSPHAQMALHQRLSAIADVVSCDGNMHAQQAQRCRFWRTEKGRKGHWVELSEVGDTERGKDTPLRAFRRSCANIRAAWGQHD